MLAISLAILSRQNRVPSPQLTRIGLSVYIQFLYIQRDIWMKYYRAASSVYHIWPGIASGLRDPARFCNTEIPVLRRPKTGLFGIGVEPKRQNQKRVIPRWTYLQVKLLYIQTVQDFRRWCINVVFDIKLWHQPHQLTFASTFYIQHKKWARTLSCYITRYFQIGLQTLT